MAVRTLVITVVISDRGEHLVYSVADNALFDARSVGALRAGADVVDEAFLSAHGVLDLELGRAKQWLAIHGHELG